MLGKPVIKGTGITVELVLKKIAGGYSFDEIIQMYPHISQENLWPRLDMLSRSYKARKHYKVLRKALEKGIGTSIVLTYGGFPTL